MRPTKAMLEHYSHIYRNNAQVMSLVTEIEILKAELAQSEEDERKAFEAGREAHEVPYRVFDGSEEGYESSEWEHVYMTFDDYKKAQEGE